MWQFLFVLSVAQGIVSSASNTTNVNPEVYMNIVSFNFASQHSKESQIESLALKRGKLSKIVWFYFIHLSLLSLILIKCLRTFKHFLYLTWKVQPYFAKTKEIICATMYVTILLHMHMKESAYDFHIWPIPNASFLFLLLTVSPLFITSNNFLSPAGL